MLSATQTQPPLRWLSYVFRYIHLEYSLLFADNYPQNINSDTCNCVFSNILTVPASATIKRRCKLKGLHLFIS